MSIYKIDQKSNSFFHFYLINSCIINLNEQNKIYKFNVSTLKFRYGY
jgi:hypothetical protein